MHRKETNQTGTRGGAHCIVSIPQVASISQNDSFLGRARLLLQCDGHRTLRIFLGRLVSTVAVPLGAYVLRLQVLVASLEFLLHLIADHQQCPLSAAQSVAASRRYTCRPPLGYCNRRSVLRQFAPRRYVQGLVAPLGFPCNLAATAVSCFGRRARPSLPERNTGESHHP